MTSHTHKKLPNSSRCFACGLENDYGLKLSFYQEGDDSIVVDYVVPDHYQVEKRRDLYCATKVKTINLNQPIF